MNQLILASTSPRRSELLLEAGFRPLVVAPNVEEIHSIHLTPRELTQLNAHRKAVRVAAQHTEAVVLAADTLVALGTRIFGKPSSVSHAAQMLGELSGKTHEVITGVSLIHVKKRKVITDAVHTFVTFKKLRPAEIKEYLDRIEPLDKAGAYAAQVEPESIIRHVEGSFSNVIGLPMEMVSELLNEFEAERTH